MAIRTSQYFIRTDATAQVADCLRKYCKANKNRFVPHRRYRLDGIEQMLRIFAKHQRRFFVMPPADTWTTFWEIIEHVSAADPAIAAMLSKELKTESVWITMDTDYNIWAFQAFNKGKVIDEAFLPKDYFLGKGEDGDLSSYGDCMKFATKLERKLKLPHFLLSFKQVERNKKIFDRLTKVQVRF